MSLGRTFNIKTLAEGMQRQTAVHNNPEIVKRWQESTLLEGLGNMGQIKMARLLENQLVELLRGASSREVLAEANALSTGGGNLIGSGQIAGFTNVAFPLVRRIFAGLVANEVVSVQPMSLPSTLLFYLDYDYGSNVGGDAGVDLSDSSTNEVYTRGDSVYNDPTGAAVRFGSTATGGQYDLAGNGYTKVQKQALNLSTPANSVGAWSAASVWSAAATVDTAAEFVGPNARFARFNEQIQADLEANVLDYCFMFMSASTIAGGIPGADIEDITQIAVTGFSTPGSTVAWDTKGNYQGGTGVLNLRKLNTRGNWDGAGTFSVAQNGSHVMFVLALANGGTAPTVGNITTQAITASATIHDALNVNSDGSAVVVPSFETNFALDASPKIPEVQIKIESVPVTATTRKLRARWSPEMAQDVTAFYAMDIEQELTNIISEMVTLDIDRELLNDLLQNASAARYYWSRSPGKMVNFTTGNEATRATSLSPGPAFTGNVREWYETLVETITAAAQQIHKKTLRGSGNMIITSPEIAVILEHTTAYKAKVQIDSDGQVADNMTIGAESVGTLNARYKVLVDPYFPANQILVARKGSTFLETGYVYAPYVPLILTPIVYRPEDFTPQKGLMTRYGKKMIRSDFYATVTVLDLSII